MSKRGNIFAQGEKTDPYNEHDAPSDTPKQATAAQLAARKLKTARPRRTGMTSGLGGSPAPNAFTSIGGFGGNNNSNPNNPIGGFVAQPNQNGGFNTGTSSFPPTQPSNQSNAFANTSFPGFGAGNNAGFNPPSSSTFNFTTNASNPFASSAPNATAATNGSGSTGFVFGGAAAQPQSQAPANSFGGLAQNSTATPASGSMFGQATPSTAPSQPQSNMFGTGSAPQSTPFGTSNAPQSNLFGTTSSAAQSNLFGTGNAPQSTPFGTASSAPQSNLFGTSSATTQSNMFGTSNTPQNNAFDNSGTNTNTPAAQTPGAQAQPSVKFGFGTSAAPASSTATPSASASPGAFNFLGAANSATPTPSKFTFGASSASAPDGGKASTAGAGSSFAGAFGAKDTSTTPVASATSSEGQSASTPAPASNPFGWSKPAGQESTAAPTSNLFGNSKSTTAAGEASAATPKANPFSGLSATPVAEKETTSTSTAKPPSSNLFGGNAGSGGGSLFGEIKSTPGVNNGGASSSKTPFPWEKSDTPPAPKTSFEPKTSFAGTPQAAFSSQTSTTQNDDSAKQQSFSLFNKPAAESTKSDAPSKPNFSFSSQTAKSDTPQKPGFNFPSPTAKPDATPKPGFTFPSQSAKTASSEATTNVLNKSTPATAMPTLTGAAAPPSESGPTQPLSRLLPGKNWTAPPCDENNVAELMKKLAYINNAYLTKMATFKIGSDWSALSKWHFTETVKITNQITAVKKQKAAEKGITGNESSLSVKRKPEADVNREDREGSPTKRQRADNTPATPTPKAFAMPSTTPKASPPASKTSSIFGNAINKGSASSSLTFEKKSEPTRASASQAPFGNANATDSSKKGFFQSPFEAPKPEASASRPGLKLPNFAPSSKPSSGGATNFMAQFGSSAKTAEQMRAERKAKAKDEDYDSDDETEEAWSARWDKEEAERVAKEKEKLKATTAPKKTTADAASGSGILQSASGTSSVFGSRTSSPAPSNGRGTSVFDSPAGGSTPTQGNLFGHLSSTQSPDNQEDESEDNEDGEDDGGEDKEDDGQSLFVPQPKTAISTKRKLEPESTSESDEYLEDAMRRKKQDATKKPSLFDRITYADPSEIEAAESEKENSQPGAISSTSEQTNGLQTPAPKPKFTFDFAGAGGQTAPPKSNTFAGDQTFKAGTPIKFGSAIKPTEGLPTFQFQPSTPASSEFSATPSKPPGPVSFSFLNAGNGQSSAGSSRAATPLSEAPSSTASAAGDDEEEEAKSEQVDLSALTEDERAICDVLFSTEQALVKHQKGDEPTAKWEIYAKGALYILKEKESGKAFVRMRLSSGATRLNYIIPQNMQAIILGTSGKMLRARGKKELEAKLSPLFFAFKSPELAQEFLQVHNENT